MIRRAAPGLVLLAVGVFFFAPEILGGRIAATANMAHWWPWRETATAEQLAAPSHNPDCNLSYYPRRAMMRAAWQDGEVPFWNPYSFCGTPFFSDVQSGVFYPPNWLLLPMDPGRQLGWFLFLHAVWGGIGVYALARRASVPVPVAVAAGAAFLLNGYFAKHFGQPTFLASASWLPWVLHGALTVLDRPGLASMGRLGLIGAMSFLAGQPQTAIHGVYAALVVVATTRLVRRPAPSPLPRALLALAGAGVLAGLLVSVQLLPTADLVSRSARAVLPYGSVISGAFHPVDAVRFLVPEFFGTPLTGDEWSPLFPRGDGFYVRNQLNSVFAGTPVFLLALWGMVGPRTRRIAAPFTALFAIAVLLAFGSPLARLAYEFLPGFRFSRIDRAGTLVVLAQMIPAALGAADLARASSRTRRALGAAFVGIAILGVVSVRLAGSSLPLDASRLVLVVERTQTAMLFAGLAGVAIIALGRRAPWLPLAVGAVQLFLFAGPYRGDRSPDEVFAPHPSLETLASSLAGESGGGRLVRFGRDPARAYSLSGVLPPSTNAPYRLRDLQGYNALADRRLGEALEIAWDEPVFSHGIWKGRRIVAPEHPSSLEHPLVDGLSVGVALAAAPVDGAWPARRLAGFTVLTNPGALPRIRLEPAGSGITETEMERRLRERDLRPGEDAIWVGVGSAGGEGETGSDELEILADGWNEIVVRTTTSKERVLVVADSHAPGWRATVDGSTTDVLPVYGLVRGVVVPPGRHTVRLSYRPPRFGSGLALTLLGLALTGLSLSLPGRLEPGNLVAGTRVP